MEAENLKKNIEDVDLSLEKVQAEKETKEVQIKALQDEMAAQDESIAKANREKKHQDEVNRKLTEDLQGEEDKVNHLNKVKGKLEHALDDLEDQLEREKRLRQDADKVKRKIEAGAQVRSGDHRRTRTCPRKRPRTPCKKREVDMHATQSRLEDEQTTVHKLQRSVKDYQNRVGGGGGGAGGRALGPLQGRPSPRRAAARDGGAGRATRRGRRRHHRSDRDEQEARGRAGQAASRAGGVQHEPRQLPGCAAEEAQRRLSRRWATSWTS